MATIFRKTGKGTDEIATRANRLVPRLRTALILVDGARDEAELLGLLAPGSSSTLQELLSLGYIEAVPVVAPPKPEKASTAATAPAASEKSFASFRADAVRAFNDLTGPDGEAFAIKMEQTNSREELAPLLQTAFELIGKARGARLATEFKARFASF
jgi:hypothetical protein